MLGKTISHYKILEKLGSGGMGVVYKAEDTKLQRIVALKFLPAHLSISTEDNQRLLNEAQLAARLNHQHICTIYDISDTDDEKFIVMEYVDGITLRQKIKDSSLSIDESVEYAIQIGSALEEAHSKGIIHRDIKPDNIMINSQNQIKVMDFGIAKLKEGLEITRTMSTSGTVAYMAPEQLSNSRIDGRVDIFSLGILLYEMLTSRLPFRGDHQAAMMYSIMNEEPEPINKYLLEVPSELFHILNRALEKDPEDRYQNVHDFVIDLRRLKKQTHKITHSFATSDHINVTIEQIPKQLKSRIKSKRKILFITILTVLILCVVAVILFIPKGPQINPEMTTRTIQLPFKNVYRGAMSKDGNWVVFSAEDENGKYNVYMMNLAEGQPKKVTNNKGGRIGYSGLSPDANTILFSRFNIEKNRNEIVSIPSSGGEERVIIERGSGPEWRYDGQRFLYWTTKLITNNLRVINYWSAQTDGSNRRIEIADTFKTRAGYRISSYYSPDGNSIVRTKNFSEGYSEIVIFDMTTKINRQLTFDKKFADDPCWGPNDQIIYSSNKTGNVNLWIVSSKGGESLQLTRGSGHDVRSGFSGDGKRFLYAETHEGLGHIFIGNLKDGTYKLLTLDDRQRSFPTISNDAKQIAFIAQELNDVSNIWNVYIMNIDGSNIHRITDDKMYKSYPFWSSDDKWIIYSASLPQQPADSTKIYFVRTDNSIPPQTMGYGRSPIFLNEKEFIFNKSMTTYKGTVDSKIVEKISEDSLMIIPILKGEYLWIYDSHIDKRTLFFSSLSNYKKNGLKEAKLIFKGMIYLIWPSDEEIFYLRIGGDSEIRKITFPDCKDVICDFEFPGIKSSYDFSISRDGKRIVYANYYNTAKYVVIDNLFK